MNVKDIQAMEVNNNLLNLIAPNGIKFNKSKVDIGENVCKYMYINGYATKADIGWLTEILNLLGATITINIIPIDSQQYIYGIDRGISNAKATADSSRSEVEKIRARLEVNYSEKIIEEVQGNLTSYVYISIISRVIAKTEEELERNCKLFRNKVSGMGLKSRICSFLSKEAYLQSSPFARTDKNILKISNRNMPLSSFFGGLPFSRKWICRYNRILYGYR